MSSARLWHGGQLVAGWIVAIAAVVLVRWALIQGIYETAIENRTVQRVSGLWPEEFATLVTLLLAGIAFSALAWLTGSWIVGRRTRAALRATTGPVHRRILM